MKPPYPLNQLTALVIDDDKLVRQILMTALGSQGYTVHTADDGQEGLELARKLRPDLLVLDGRLPRLDGLDVIRQLRNDPLCAHVKIIFTASRSLTSDIKTALAEGADAYLPQPLDVEELLQFASKLNGRQIDPQNPANMDHDGYGL